MSEIVSERACFRIHQALREEAAQLGLNGYAEVTRHERMSALMEQGAKPAPNLLDADRLEEAVAMMECNAWGMENQEEARTDGQTLAGD